MNQTNDINVILVMMAILFVCTIGWLFAIMIKQEPEYQEAHRKLNDYIARKNKNRN